MNGWRDVYVFIYRTLNQFGLEGYDNWCPHPVSAILNTGPDASFGLIKILLSYRVSHAILSIFFLNIAIVEQ